jgi:DNA-binding Lrp family transcriptional regulator
MEDEMIGSKRTRGWVLVKAKDGASKKEISDRIRNIKTEGDNFIVRADIVMGDYDIVCALDMENSDSFGNLLGEIKSVTGVDQYISLVVNSDKTHNPDPPHDSTGTITEDEAAASTSKNSAGTTGFNPWG